MKKTLITLSTIASVAAIYVATPSVTKNTDNNKCLNVKDVESIPNPTPENTFFEPVRSILSVPQPYSGGIIEFSVDNSITIKGTINAIHRGLEETVAIGGDIHGGWFSVIVNKDGTTEAYLMIESRRIAYVLEATPLNGTVRFVKKSWNEVMCGNVSVDQELAGAATVTSGTTDTSTSAVPILNSRTGAKVTLYLEFRGATVTDVWWNGGKTIQAASPGYDAAKVTQTFNVVAQKYSNFNVNVTTDPNLYNTAPVGSRMRVIFTPTQFIKGFSGIAWIGSLPSTSGSWTRNIPCWVFTNTVSTGEQAGLVAAHELGHTFGLRHDGVNKVEYYNGNKEVSWAPIMGTSIGKKVVQWSRGEYTGANNIQDDIKILSGITGYASALAQSTSIAGVVEINDVVRYSGDAGTYTFRTYSGGAVRLVVNVPVYSMLDSRIELIQNGVTVAVGTASGLNSILTATVKAGVYTVKVSGEGFGDVRSAGYSSYGSVGDFKLTGNVPAR